MDRKAKIAVPAFAAAVAIAGAFWVPGTGPSVKTSVLESGKVADHAAFSGRLSQVSQPIRTADSGSKMETAKVRTFNSAPTALVGFLEDHFDISAKYHGGGDGSLCTEELPCFDHTPPEVADAIARIHDGVMTRLGNKYDSETFYRIFFMTEEGQYDPARHPKVRLDDVAGSVDYIVDRYLA